MGPRARVAGGAPCREIDQDPAGVQSGEPPDLLDVEVRIAGSVFA